MIEIKQKTLKDYQTKLEELEGQKKYNKRRIFKNAYYRMSRSYGMTFSEALKEAWAAARRYRAKELAYEIDEVLGQIRRLYEITIPLKLEIEWAERDMAKAAARGVKIY